MPIVRLVQEIFPPESAAGINSDHPPKRWYYDLETAFAPTEGSEIHVFGEDYATNTVRRTYWFLDGTLCAEMTPYQVDPLPKYRSLINGRYRKLWSSDPDGDPHEILAACGWREEQ